MEEFVGGVNLLRISKYCAVLQNISDSCGGDGDGDGIVQFRSIAFQLDVKNDETQNTHYY